MSSMNHSTRPFLADTSSPHDDAIHDKSLRLDPFDVSSDDRDLEHASPLTSSRRPISSRPRNWWHKFNGMALRARRKFEEDENEMLMTGFAPSGSGPRRKRSLYSWCVFGSVSGLSLL
jgi:hypothetical protein